MKRAVRRHFDVIHKKKKHPASKCNKPKCIICHCNKVLGVKHPKDVRKIESGLD